MLHGCRADRRRMPPPGIPCSEWAQFSSYRRPVYAKASPAFWCWARRSFSEGGTSRPIATDVSYRTRLCHSFAATDIGGYGSKHRLSLAGACVDDAMKYFPDEPASGVWARWAVAALPLVYLAVALIYSANSAPWGRSVDPESAYMMNGIAWAAGYGMIKNDHPGTTTTLLSGLVTKLGALVGGHPDVVEFGLKNYDALIYASRAAQVFLMAAALLAGG